MIYNIYIIYNILIINNIYIYNNKFVNCKSQKQKKLRNSKIAKTDSISFKITFTIYIYKIIYKYFGEL